MKKRGGIYQIRNIINNKRYIGSTIDFERRFRQHKSDLKLNKHDTIKLQNAWNKYGEQSFIFEIIVESEDEELLVLEQKELDKFNIQEDLYNINPVAEKVPTLKGDKHPKAKLTWNEVNEIRQKYKEKKYSTLTLAKMYGICNRTMNCLLNNISWYDPEYKVEMQSSGFDYEGKRGSMTRKTKQEFIEQAVKVYGDRYDYSQIEYKNNITKIKVICLVHGAFETYPNGHLYNNRGCPSCGRETMIKKRRYSHAELVEAANKVHGPEKYSYPIQEIDSRIKIKIFCNIHKENFEQRMSSHLSGYGCPKCGIDKRKKRNVINEAVKETLIKQSIAKEIKIENIDEISALSTDTFKIFYNDLNLNSTQKNLYYINKKCELEGRKPFHIFSDEWRDKKEIVNSMINYRLGKVDRKLAARKCSIENIPVDEGKRFFDANHISGNTQSSFYLGLRCEGELVCCISMRKPVQKKYGNVIEIARFATKTNTLVNGGFQKLFKRIVEYFQDKKFDGILTYSDNRFGDGGVYDKSGFAYQGETPIDYWYTDGKERFFRFKFRADKENNLTEKQVAEESGVRKVYGCGSKIWLLNFNK